MTTTQTNKPVIELRDGTMKIAIFANQPKKEGDPVRYSGKLTRSYRDQNGNWHDTEYLSNSEYLRAANLLQRAYNAELQIKSDARDEASQ